MAESPPAKVIKVATGAALRVAQACDRCRSKKIRCDGVRPCCSPCSEVGFECRTSDKLSRRAFPRGYTESLEERVRVLEAEIRDLRDGIARKDELIDTLVQAQPEMSSRDEGPFEPGPVPHWPIPTPRPSISAVSGTDRVQSDEFPTQGNKTGRSRLASLAEDESSTVAVQAANSTRALIGMTKGSYSHSFANVAVV